MKKILLTIFIMITLGTRLLWITQIPTALTHDEMAYAFEAKIESVSHLSTNPDWRPWSLVPFDKDFAELPATLMIPAQTLFPNDPILASRITFTILSIFFPIVLGYLAYKIFKRKDIFWGVVLLATINPWLIQYGRMAFDPYLSLFFYMLAGALFLSSKWIVVLSSSLLFALGFFEYQGHKLLLLPWTSVLVVLSKTLGDHKNRASRVRIGVCALAVLLFTWYMTIALPKQSASSRTQENIIFDTSLTSRVVDVSRKDTIPNPLIDLMANKWTAKMDYIVLHYLNSISPAQLFFNANDGASPFSVWSSGYFYLVEAIFILLGVFYIIRSKKRLGKYWPLIFMLLLAPLPAMIAIVGSSYSFKASFLYMLLIIFSGIGITELWNRSRAALRVGIVFLVIISFSNFAYQYFFRYPVYSADGFYYYERILASYISRIDTNLPVTVYTKEPDRLFKSYLYYSNLISTQNSEEIVNSFRNMTYSTNNVVFTADCFDPDNNAPGIVIRDVIITDCIKQPGQVVSNPDPLYFDISIANLSDAGVKMKISGDEVCGDLELRSYPYARTLSHFEVEKLSNQVFCQTWMTKI